MKLWLDDVRPAPEGWTWVGTARNANAVVDERGAEIEAVSLDHDLGALPSDGLLARGTSEESGQVVADYIAATRAIPRSTPIRIHSWNPDGARRMAAVLREAGYSVDVRPYSLSERST